MSAGARPPRPAEANPLLEEGFEIPFSAIRPEHVRPAVERLLADAQAEIAGIATDPEPPTFATTLERLDTALQRLTEALTPVQHLMAVAETPELRSAYNEVLPLISRFWSRLYLDEGLWQRLKAFSRTEEALGLAGIRRRHLAKTLQEFRRSGAELAGEAKGRLELLKVALSRLEQKFSENVLDATATYRLTVDDASLLDGIPDHALARFRRRSEEEGRSGWTLTLDFPAYEAVIKYARDRELREEIFKAYMGRCRGDGFDNTWLIGGILSLRHEIAGTLGYPHFPDYRLEDTMAGGVTRALRFEEDLRIRTHPYFQRDFALLETHARRLGLEAVMPWDTAFLAEDLRREQFQIDDEALRPYFPLDHVQKGLFELVRRVFGLIVVEAEPARTWHPSVRYFEVRSEEGTWLGSFYTDWFPREEKRQGAWMEDFRTGRPGAGGRLGPHLGFIGGNFTPPQPGRPSLLTHREVQTLFHEFGHLLHHLTSRVPIPARGGLNVAWDWVELPSQLMENWTWEPEALALFAHHYETGELLPGELLNRLLAARRFLGGWRQMRQISFGTLDLALHTDLAPAWARAGRTMPVASRLAESAGSDRPEEADRLGNEALGFAEERLAPFSPTPEFARHHFLTSFTHLFSGGYAAGYYSYLWSEVLDADAFTRFHENGVLSADVGREYMEAILSRGDSEDPDVLFREFMGRGPDPGALVRRNLGHLESEGGSPP